MKVYLWINNCEWLNQLVLWDGEMTLEQAAKLNKFYNEVLDE